MKTFQDIMQNKGDEFVWHLMENYVIVYEKLNASTLCVKRIGDTLHFYKGSDKDEITDINITLYNYFMQGIEHIKRVSLIFYRELPEGWLFKFNYFVDNCTDIVRYDSLPQNNLILNCIIGSDSVIDSEDVLKRWAERFQTDYMKPVFQGFLSEFQKDKIKEYIKKPVEGVSFSQYIMSTLNPDATHTLYCNGFGSCVDSFIFKFFTANSSKSFNAKIMDPYLTSLLSARDEGKSRYNSENELITVSFLAYLQTVDFKDFKVKGDTDSERYLNFICELFNDYIKKEHSLFGINLGEKEKKEIKESYSVNLDRLGNKTTVELLNDHPSLHNVFQIIAGVFMDTKDGDNVSSASLLDKDTIETLNSTVTKIKDITKKKEEGTKTFADIMKDSLEPESEDGKVLDFRSFMKRNGVDIDKPADEPEHEEPKHDDTPEPTHGDGHKDAEKEKPADDGKDAEKGDEKEDKPEEKKDDLKKDETGDGGKDGEAKKDTEKKEDENKDGDEGKDEKDEKGDEEKTENEGKDKEDGTDEKKDDSEDDGKKEDGTDEEKTENEGKDKEDGTDEKKDEKPEESSEPEEKETPEKKEDTPEEKETPEKKDSKPEEKEKPKKEDKSEKKEKPSSNKKEGTGDTGADDGSFAL